MEKSRLDTFMRRQLSLNKNEVKLLLAQQKVQVDGDIIKDADFQINKFSKINVNHHIVQANEPTYIMLNKPVGVVSATKDMLHKTVIDLITHPDKEQLHIVGRLDLNTSGLMLLTNDSSWSERLTKPESKVAKVYEVLLENKLTCRYIEVFKQGFFFGYENITTAPAELIIESDYIAKVILMEGKYHQIKRMFGRFQNKVLGLHRSKIGNLPLDKTLAEGESRQLTDKEVTSIF